MEGNVHNMNENTHIGENNDYTLDKLQELMDKNHAEVLDKIESLQIKCSSCDNRIETESYEQNYSQNSYTFEI